MIRWSAQNTAWTHYLWAWACASFSSPFQKIHQDGGGSICSILNNLTICFCATGIKPFCLYAMGEAEAHLCPVHAMTEWIDASQIESGYLFWKIVSGDRVLQNDVPLVSFTCIAVIVLSSHILVLLDISVTSEQFLEMFRNNLLNVDVNPIAYGTHSFWRGGC